MKKLISGLFAILFSFSISAQTTATKETVRTAASLKTGNSQDVLTSFYQLALSDLTGNNKAFDFSSSLLAIKAKTDPSLWSSANYVKNSFARNFVVHVNAALDSNYRFKSNTFGFRYAIVNKRDKTVFRFSLDRERDWNNIMNKSLYSYLKSLNNNVKDSNFVKASNFFNDKASGIQVSVAGLPTAFRDTLNAVIGQNPFFRNQSLAQYQNHLQASYDSLSKIVENQPLWVVAGDFSSDADGKLFTALKFESEYLQGLIPNNAKSNLELHIRARATFNDDLQSIGRDLNRQVFSAFAGFNWIMLKNSQHKSILELRGGMSENYVMKGLFANEERINFSGEGTLRLRLNNSLWIPFDIKYDPQQGNVMGFLSIKSNFDWLTAAQKYLQQ